MKRLKYDIKEICTIPPPYGGVTVYVKRLIEQLQKDGFSVGGYYSESCVDGEIISSSMYDKWTWMQTSLFPIKVWKYLSEVRNYKIVHSHFSLEGMVYLWAMKCLGRKKIIVTIHNSMNKSYYLNTNRINKFFLNRMLKSDKVTWITVSEQGKQQLMSFPIVPVNPVFVIPPYIPYSEKTYLPLADEMQSYLSLHEKNIAFYGHSFMLNEGVDVYGFQTVLKMYASVLKSTSRNIGFVLCLADSSNSDRIKELHVYAGKLGIDDKIFWQIGAIDNIITLWRNVDIYVRPTSTDGDSVAVREVIDEGTIVIASDVCKRPEGVITYRFGDEEDLLQKIAVNINCPKKKVKPNFKYYKMMKNIYDDLLAK